MDCESSSVYPELAWHIPAQRPSAEAQVVDLFEEEVRAAVLVAGM
jgi:hypothetical protein